MILEGFGLFVEDMGTMIRFTGMYWGLKSQSRRMLSMCI